MYHLPSTSTLARWGFADGKAKRKPQYEEEAYRIAYAAGKRMTASAVARAQRYLDKGVITP